MAIYKITTKATVSDESGAKFSGAGVRLVDAKTKAQAIAHYARRTHGVALAIPEQLIAATKAGVEVERAGEAE